MKRAYKYRFYPTPNQVEFRVLPL
ncbi:helix-turn-helix domain-containing protein [Salmonella enterica subsp. enterica serovar Infantis]|uniref:Helix-turn-helix domain-containing protein n=6 Tax=Salmonella enterica TaxID=28901 RepID=A0A5T4ALA9_SALMU|nr:hypothetical protein CGA24_01105 [Salmonella enterica subsp. enterica]EAA0433506.1 hypothetical protein [Salmonella enterica]EAA2741108.1 hypothetical protein [Salmonella enterica subsp. enterica serovar Infantis]EAY4523269.1 hypothetical protein [Salmonella enterica subsp. enterica serovar -:r:1,5]EBF8195009.1 hypothetical protein [Salmonella enterica subsp. enterica serovar Muenchen]EBG0215839.1 hypothetical protein [Salmonella enterica subsp. enterica serovar Louisiana]EBK2702339.1 hypo